MAQMRLTLIGLYNYDSTLFDGMVLPDGIDADLVKNTILQKSGEFELLYPNIDYMKSMIQFWAKKHERTFEKWNEALNIKYDPLFNFDRHEEYSDVKGGNTKSSTKGSTTPPQTTTTNTDTVAAYDASTYQPKEQKTDQLTVQAAGSDSTDSDGSYNEVIKHEARLYGNIGVTTSQQMLQSELDIARFNLYEQIADIFIEEFCIMIY